MRSLSPLYGLHARIDGSGLQDVDELAASAVAEPDDAVDGGEQGVVATAAHVVAGVEPGAALAHDDRAGAHVGPGRDLHAQSLRRRIASVPRGGRALLLRHVRKPTPSWAAASWRAPSSSLRPSSPAPSSQPAPSSRPAPSSVRRPL